MKPSPVLILPATVGLAAAALTLDWYTLDGGGGASKNGRYAVVGTIGQADAGIHSGGSYTVTGGFWALPELLQTPKGPLLELRATGGLHAAWPAPSPGWRLETSTDLLAWSTVPGSPEVVDGYNLVAITFDAARRYYRLAFP